LVSQKLCAELSAAERDVRGHRSTAFLDSQLKWQQDRARRLQERQHELRREERCGQDGALTRRCDA
jgi:hypothetical protein